jgi:hypothetical protein
MRLQFAVPSRLLVTVLTALVAFGATRAAAQQRDLRGVVTDTVGYPIPNVEVRIMDLGRMARTDTAGRFAINRISDRVVDLTVRRLGYEVRFVRVSLINGEGDSLVIKLKAEPVRLASVEIEAEERHHYFTEFDNRRLRGLGTFITKDQIEKLNTSYPSDAFRRLPGMRFVNVTGGMGVRFMSSTGIRGTRGSDCAPTIWVDGTAAVGMEIDDIRAADIHGIEIYRGASTTPAQFSKAGLTQCGAIVVWTKRKR